MIKYDKSKRKWVLYTKDGSKILGTFDTYKDAKKRELQILYFKNKKGRD